MFKYCFEESELTPKAWDYYVNSDDVYYIDSSNNFYVNSGGAVSFLGDIQATIKCMERWQDQDV